MVNVFVDRCRVLTATTGVGTLTLGDAVTGFRSFSQAVIDGDLADGDQVSYCIEDGVNWEVGSGTYNNTAGTLTRTPSSSSIGGTALTLSGNAQVFITIPASFQNVVATGSTTARSLSNRFSDIINVKDYGAVLDGTTDDTAAFQAAFNACPSKGIILVPSGGYHLLSNLTNASNKDVLWILEGNSFGTGTTPVTSVMANATTETYIGRKYFKKIHNDSGVGYAVVDMVMDNQTTNAGTDGVTSNLHLTTTSEPGCGGFSWGINSELFAKSTGGFQQDVSIASTVWRTGSCPTWQYFGQTVDKTGVPPNSGSSIVGFEMDVACNGPENANTAFNPNVGSRVCFQFVNHSYDPPVWAATTVYAVGDVITASPTNGFTYVCTVGGTSGSTQPTFPTSAGTVSDGTVTWSFGTTIASQISRCIQIGSDSDVQIGTGLYTNATFYNSVLDFTGATLTGSSPAGIRLTANMPIDFSADGTLAGQNVRTMQYDGNLSYRKSGSRIFGISDLGSLVIGGSSFGIDVGIEVLGSWVDGIRFVNATLSGPAIQLASGQNIAWEATNVRKTGYSGGFVVDYNNTTQIRKLDASGNEVLTGSITSVGIINSGSLTTAPRIVTAAGNVTMTSTDHVLILNKTAGAATTITLPSSPTSGRRVTIKDGKGDANTNNITITPSSGTIDGAANFVLSVNFASVDLIWNGSAWNII